MADPRLQLAQGTGPALHTGTVVAPVADLCARPSRDCTPECQLLLGDRFRVHAHREDWSYGAALGAVSEQTDYVGWVRTSALAEVVQVPTHRVHTLRAPVWSRPDIKSPIHQLLPLNARLRSTGTVGDFEQMGGGGFVHAQHLLALAGTEISAFAHDFVDTAESFQGLPYIWGGNGPDGMDCSGLVKLSLESAGHASPRDADQQEAALGRPHPADDALMTLRRGDLVFWPGHVGVMQTSGRLLHANAHHMRVATEPLREAVARIGPIRTVKRIP